MKNTEQIINLTSPIDGVQYGYSTTDKITGNCYFTNGEKIWHNTVTLDAYINLYKVLFSTNPKDLRFPYLVMSIVQRKTIDCAFCKEGKAILNIYYKCPCCNEQFTTTESDTMALNIMPSKEQEVDEIAKVESERTFNFPYCDFQGKEKGVDDEHTGQALRGAYCQGFEQGFNANPAKYNEAQMRLAFNKKYLGSNEYCNEKFIEFLQSLQPTAKAVRVEMESYEDFIKSNPEIGQLFKIKVEQSTEYSQGIVRAIEIIY